MTRYTIFRHRLCEEVWFRPRQLPCRRRLLCGRSPCQRQFRPRSPPTPPCHRKHRWKPTPPHPPIRLRRRQPTPCHPTELGGPTVTPERADYVPGGEGIYVSTVDGHILYWIQNDVFYTLSASYPPPWEREAYPTARELASILIKIT